MKHQKLNKGIIFSISLLILSFAFTGVGFAQEDLAPEVEWSKTYGGDNYDKFNAVEQTTDGGYILVGQTGSYGVHYFDIWLVKTDADGNESWARTFGGDKPYAIDGGFSVQQTSDGGYIVTGYKNLTNWGGIGYRNDRLWLLKTDANGSLEWERDLGESVYYEGSYGPIAWGIGYSVRQTGDGGYVVIGAGQPRSDRAEAIFLIKTDAFGNKIWEQVFHGGGSPPYWTAFARSVQQTSDGGYIIAGRIDGPMDIMGWGDMWLIKTDDSGNIQWDKAFGREYVDPSSGQLYPGTESANSVQQTTDGGYVITGISYNPRGYRPWIIYQTWLIKTNAFGEKIWDVTFEERWGQVVQQTSDGGYIVISDAWLTKIDSYGNQLWEKLIDGGLSQDGLQTADGGYALAGYGGGPPGGWPDGWLVKLSPEAVKANELPIANAGGSYEADEGSPITFDASGSYDPDGNIVSYEWDFGNGYTASGWLGLPYAYGDNGIYTATLTVKDDDGGVGQDTLTVTVNNVAPIVDVGEDRVIYAGAEISLGPATFADAGWLDSHTATIDWGDGIIESGGVSELPPVTPEIPALPEPPAEPPSFPEFPEIAGTISGSHVYWSVGTYTVTLTVTDDGGVGTDTLIVVVNPVPATTDCDPDTLNLNSNGEWITCYIELPAGYDVWQIDATTVTLEGIPAETDPKYDFVSDPSQYLIDHDGDGVLERMVKFDRAQVQSILNPGEAVLTLIGKVGLADFEGQDTIRVIDKGKGKK